MKGLSVLLLVLGACLAVRAQGPADATGSSSTVDISAASIQDWTEDIDNVWRVRQGDNPAWAQPAFDDSAWESVDLDDLGVAEPGWRWYRLHIRLDQDHPDLSLLLLGSDGSYELYINGVRAPGALPFSSLLVARPTERTFPVAAPGTDLVLALRTYTIPAYSHWHLPLFLGATLGTPSAIESARQSFESGRLYTAIPIIVINLLLLLSGLAAFGLYRNQPTHSEYLWLGLYLCVMAISDMLWGCQVTGVFPLVANFVIADPLIYIFTIAQIEFTYSFGGRQVGRAWRIYEALLLAPIALIWFNWHNLLPVQYYLFIEALVVVPVGLLLPVFLFVWYRRGNREAGWLVLPSLLPAAIVTLGNLGSISIFLGWHSFDFLDNTIPVGRAQLEVEDAGNLLYLLAIAVVMFFRFTRVSREQARTAAELDAAREIQQRLVPSSLPAIPGFRLQAAYWPAQEVGGDFYQVLDLHDGSILVIVGDVSGKGLKAAMTGALAMGTLRALAAERLQPAAILERTNLQIIEANNGGFITCLCMRIAADGTAILANAGHLSPYRNGNEVPLDPALPLGLSPGAVYPEHTIQINRGDSLTLLSDGVVEATNSTGELFGFERTREISSESAESIAHTARQFGQEDDITVLTVQRD